MRLRPAEQVAACDMQDQYEDGDNG